MRCLNLRTVVVIIKTKNTHTEQTSIVIYSHAIVQCYSEEDGFPFECSSSQGFFLILGHVREFSLPLAPLAFSFGSKYKATSVFLLSISGKCLDKYETELHLNEIELN